MTDTQHRCDGITDEGNQCSRNSCVTYDGKHYCKTHLKKTKANEQCPICLDDMTKTTRVDVCGYGHYYHKKCMELCRNISTCPTCKRQTTSNASMKIYEDLDRLRRMEIYALELPLQQSILRAEDGLMKCAYNIGTDQIGTLCEVLEDITKISKESRHVFMDVMRRFLTNLVYNEQTHSNDIHAIHLAFNNLLNIYST